MPTSAMAVLRRYVPWGTPALRMMSISADSEMMYGMTLVTTARLTRTENCSLRLGEIVDNARIVCTTPMTIMPITGADMLLVLAKKAGNRRSPAAVFAVW